MVTERERNCTDLTLHAGFVEAGLEVLTDFMCTPEELLKEWKQISRKAGPFSGSRKRNIFNTIRAGSIFCDPEKTEAFAQKLSGRIDKRLSALLELFASYPWKYTLFEVHQILDQGIVEIMIDKRRELLFSPQSATEKEKGGHRFLGLLFFNGKCIQSWGEIVPLDSFFEEDLHYLAGESRPEIYAEEGVEAAIHANPLPFLLLKVFAGLPMPLLHGKPARPCASTICLPDFDIKRLELCRCRTEAIHRGIMHRISLGSDYTVHPPTLYINQKSNALFLSSLTLEGYKKARMALLPVAEFPETPQRIVGGTMQYAVHEMLGTNPPWMDLDAHFLPGKDSKKGIDTLERLEAAVYHCLDTGKEVLPELVSERSGVDIVSTRLFLDGLKDIITGRPAGLSYGYRTNKEKVKNKAA
jgi:hypothetical protein